MRGKSGITRSLLSSVLLCTDTAKYCREMEARENWQPYIGPSQFTAVAGATDKPATECRHTRYAKKQVTTQSCFHQLGCLQTVILNPHELSSELRSRKDAICARNDTVVIKLRSVWASCIKYKNKTHAANDTVIILRGYDLKRQIKMVGP